MPDIAERYTDEQADRFARKIKGIYSQAAREVRRKFAGFQAGQAVIGARMKERLQRGEITKKQYAAWMQGQVFQGKQWQKQLAEITAVYVHADEKAREILGGTVHNVFTEAANYTAFKIVEGMGGAVSFNLYDKNTVERLALDNPDLLPEWKIDEPKDYVWNRDRVQNAVTQGIIQGESIGEIGKRLTTELAGSNASKMNMFARTAMTGAQNAGRVDRMREADESYGIKAQKQWLSCGDDKVRDTHRLLNGVTVDYDKPFTVPMDGRKIDYPGDPHADADLVYNCRCTLIYIQPHSREYDYTPGGHHLPEYDRYQEWKRQEAERNGG